MFDLLVFCRPQRGARPAPRAKQPAKSRGNSATSTAIAYGGDGGDLGADKPQEGKAPAK